MQSAALDIIILYRDSEISHALHLKEQLHSIEAFNIEIRKYDVTHKMLDDMHNGIGIVIAC